MKILIVSATTIEINPLLQALTFNKAITPVLSNYSYNGHNIDILITGVGMVPTAYFLGKILATNKYDLALNIGIAGSYNKSYNIGNVVNVTKDLFSELGAEDGEYFLSIIDIKLIEQDKFPFENGEIINNSITDNNTINTLPKVKGITVNTVHGKKESIAKIRKTFSPDIESMEGAAFLYACLSERINCFQIRAISNLVELRNRKEWNIPLAVKNLNDTILKII
jgi:futalosine hydrolase